MNRKQRTGASHPNSAANCSAYGSDILFVTGGCSFCAGRDSAGARNPFAFVSDRNGCQWLPGATAGPQHPF